MFVMESYMSAEICPYVADQPRPGDRQKNHNHNTESSVDVRVRDRIDVVRNNAVFIPEASPQVHSSNPAFILVPTKKQTTTWCVVD